MFGYPPYFILKRHLKQEAFNGVLLETLLLFPIAVWLIMISDKTQALSIGNSSVLLIGLGVMSGSALVLYLMASQRLTFTTFGMLSYVEPLLLFTVSLLLPSKTLSMTNFLTYLPIWLAGNDSNLLIVFYVQIMPDDFVMQLHRF